MCVCVFTSPMSRLAGLLYRSPELLRLADPPLQGTQKGDIYSFGILLYAIHGRQGPFGFTPLSTNDILKKVTEYAPPLPPFRSSSFDNYYIFSFSFFFKIAIRSFLITVLSKKKDMRHLGGFFFLNLPNFVVNGRPVDHSWRSYLGFSRTCRI